MPKFLAIHPIDGKRVLQHGLYLLINPIARSIGIKFWRRTGRNLNHLLRIIAFIVIIASLVQFSELVMRATQPLLHQVLGLFVPLITTNCAVLGVALLNSRTTHNFAESIIYGFGAALGFSGLLIVFAALREKQQAADIPAPFRGAAINMITAGILSLGFLGFTGMN